MKRGLKSILVIFLLLSACQFALAQNVISGTVKSESGEPVQVQISLFNDQLNFNTMIFGFIIMRLLFIASMIFVIGYIFGGFSKRPVLATLAKIGAILVIILFIASNIFFGRFGYGHYRGWHNRHWCDTVRTDKRP